MLLAKVLPTVEPSVVAEALGPRLPWTRLLPPAALEEFGRESAETLEAFASIGNMKRVSEVLADWGATAEVHAAPALAAECSW